jgi:excisionase family DNA binding protein
MTHRPCFPSSPGEPAPDAASAAAGNATTSFDATWREENALDSLYTVDEVAQALRLAPCSVYERIARGELPAARLGSGPKAPIRVRAEDLDRYLMPKRSLEAGASRS